MGEPQQNSEWDWSTWLVSYIACDYKASLKVHVGVHVGNPRLI